MKKLNMILLCLVILLPIVAHAAPSDPPPPGPAPRRVSIFSTSTDWEAITNLRLSEYSVDFLTDARLVGKGLELYYLDGFPCFGQADRTNIWIGPNNKINRAIRLTCLYVPEKVYFAWRNIDRDTNQGKTQGILECPNRETSGIKIDLSKCITGKDWTEFK